VSKRDRVTILGLNYAPEPTGNAPYTAALARHLQHTGRDVTVLTTFPHYPQWRRYAGYAGWRTAQDDDGVRLIRLRHWIPNPPRGTRRLISEITFGARVLFARWHRPETVILVSPALFSTWFGMIRLVFKRNTQRVVWVQDLYSQGMEETGEGGSAARRVVRAIEGWTLRRAHVVVAIHGTMAARMSSSLRVDPERITTIPNWTHVTASRLAPEAAKEQLGWPAQFTALHAGNMGLKQGLEVVVAAARIAREQGRDLRFVLMGDGGARRRLEELAGGLENVDFVDPLDQSQFPIALAAADVLLVTEAPGIAEMAAPSKLTSYFAAGRPVAASVAETGIVASIMEDASAGPVAVGGDASALLEAIGSLQGNAAAYEAACSNAVAYWERKLSPDHALVAWEHVLRPPILSANQGGELT